MRKSVQKILHRVTPLCLAALLLVSGFYLGGNADAAFTDPLAKYDSVVKVGLRYDRNYSYVSSATLENYSGPGDANAEGFEIGYFDDDRDFHELETTWETSLYISADGYDILVDGESYRTRGYNLAVRPIAADEGEPLTWFDGSKYYGAFEFFVGDSGYINVVNVLDSELYLRGVVPSEMPASWGVEALKAQAMCARNFMATHLQGAGGYHADFDLCRTTCCQAYNGRNVHSSAVESDKVYANTDRAVEETEGLYLLYNNTLCQTYYHSSNGGATESCVNVWTKDLPYLTGRIDEWDTTVSQNFRSWSFEVTAEEISDILADKGYYIGDLTGIDCEYTDVGNIYGVTFHGTWDDISFYRQNAGLLSSWLSGSSYYSQRFTITGEKSSGGGQSGVCVNDSGNLKSLRSAYAVGSGGSPGKVSVSKGKVSVLTGSGVVTIPEKGMENTSGGTQSGDVYTIQGGGWGHNVGMSQYGAYAMAKEGYDFEEILEYYFSGAVVA